MSDWTSTILLFASVGILAYIKNQNNWNNKKMEQSVPVSILKNTDSKTADPIPAPADPKPADPVLMPQKDLSDKTKTALQEAIDKKDEKTEKWIKVSIQKGYEGVGVIPYIFDPVKLIFYFVLGINKKGDAEYPGGKVELTDSDKEDTVRREVLEETGLDIAKNRFVTGFDVNGGTTGFPSYVFVVEFTDSEFKQMKSKDKTFSEFILVQNIFGDKVKDENTGKEYDVRNFNKKYVLPQVMNRLFDYIEHQRALRVPAQKR